MKIIVVSDSHGSYHSFKRIMQLNRDADIVVHCGDSRDELDEIKLEFPDKMYYCVKGNCDWEPLPLTLDFTVEGVHFFATHGHMFNVKYGLGELERAARERGAQVALFGHTHIQHDEYIDGVRLFNPGSCGFGKSFGVIEVKNGQVLSNIARVK